MSKHESLGVLTLLGVILLIILTSDFKLLSDENDFLKDFVGTEMLGFLGVILTLAIGLAAQLYTTTRKLFDRLDASDLEHLRSEIKSTAKTLILTYFLALAVTFGKSFTETGTIFEAILNSIAVMIIVFFFLALSDVVLSLFDIDP